jgi:hypothetical protein
VAIARRTVWSLAETSTIWACPSASKWVSGEEFWVELCVMGFCVIMYESMVKGM